MTSNNNVFEVPTSGSDEEIPSYYEHLVGDGKKFKDNEALAKGKYEADKTVAAREAELAEIRKELNTRISLEEFMTKQNERTSNNQPQAHVAPVAANEGQESNDNISVVVAKEIAKAQANATRAKNAEISIAKMKEAWGTNATTRLEQVSRSLGLGKEFLQDLAERSPDAFAQVIGAVPNTNKVQNITPPNTRVNSAANVSERNTVRNEEYWDKMKQTDPKFYFSAQGYNQRHSDALTLGEAYFS